MRLILFVVLCLVSSSSILAQSSLVFIEPWVRQAPPTAQNLAGYGELKNNSDREVSIASISSPSFKRIEIHITTFSNGMMKMTKLNQVTLKSGDSLLFEPGGKHLMLIKPQESIVDGVLIPISIQLKSGEIFDFQLNVRR